MNFPAEIFRTRNSVRMPVAVLLACFFSYVARHRFVDGDEGFYLLASRLVLNHKTPYLDFFYTQAPLLPYVYGLWMKLFGISWFSARTLSSVLTAMVGMLIYEHICRETGKLAAGMAAIVLFASSVLVFGWFPIVQTYSLATLFLFGAYVTVARLSPASSRWLVAGGGLLFGLSVDTRSYLVGLAPVFLLWILLHTRGPQRRSRIFWFAAGFTIGILPCVCLFAASPDLFLFNNLGFHAIRSHAGLIGNWRQKMSLAKIFLSGRQDDGGQFIILAAVPSILLALRRRGGPALLALSIAFAVGFISILPTPSFVHYYCLCMPFLIVAAVCTASDFAASLRTAPQRQIAAIAVIFLMLTFVASSVPGFRAYLFTGSVVVAETSEAPNWTLGNVSAVSRAVDQLAAPNEKVASFWPGYIFASNADPYPGFESDFGWLIADKLTRAQRAKYHIADGAEIETAFATHAPEIVVLGNQKHGGIPRIAEYARILRANDYTVMRTIGDTSIFLCCSRSAAHFLP